MRPIRVLAVSLAVLAGCRAAAPPAQPSQGPKVYVVLWFDTEDYILPASDGAAERVASWLSGEGIRATFKVVGEKARTLERRGRRDVIDALKKHEIGYHSNFHSVHPTPAQYLSTLGWDEGVAEFERREGPGFEDVRRIFGQTPSCYGQPGSSWGPQSFGALKKWGVPAYLDVGSHVGIDGRPHYYGGLLTMYRLTHVLRTGLGGAKDVGVAKEKFKKSYDQLLAEGGGLVSIFYHPCEWVHKQFWDGVNFAKGANPPREEWKLPPQKTPEETQVAYESFESWIRYIKGFPAVEFITASQAARLWRDKARGRTFSLEGDVTAIARAVGEQVTFQDRGDHALSASEVFALLNAAFVTGKAPALSDTPLGPTDPVTSLAVPVTATWSQFVRTAAEVQAFLDKRGRIPPTVWLGSAGVPPEDYLAALARVIAEKQTSGPVEVRPAALACAKHVAENSPRIWGWLFPEGFHAPALMELARRQSWTIKPAILDGTR